MDATNFLHALTELDIKNSDRAVALLWWHGRVDHNISRSPKELAADMELAGYSKQNVSRLRKSLESDRRTAKASGENFRIRITAKAALDAKFSELANHKPLRKSDSVLPADLFLGTRGYIEKVVYQLNVSFDEKLFDACTVMCRRLVETLIIEAHEAKGISDQLKDSQGNYLMLSGLISVVTSTNAIQLSRNSIKGLKDFKTLGDLSAHNRRFNAMKNDIDRVRDGLRVASEELLKISGMA